MKKYTPVIIISIVGCLIVIGMIYSVFTDYRVMEAPSTYWRFDPTDSGMYFNERNRKTGEVLRKFGPVPEYKEPIQEDISFGYKYGTRYEDMSSDSFGYSSGVRYENMFPYYDHGSPIIGFRKSSGINYNDTIIKKYRYGSTLGFDSILLKTNEHTILGGNVGDTAVGVTSDSHTIIGRIPIAVGITSDTIW